MMPVKKAHGIWRLKIGYCQLNLVVSLTEPTIPEIVIITAQADGTGYAILDTLNNLFMSYQYLRAKTNFHSCGKSSNKGL